MKNLILMEAGHVAHWLPGSPAFLYNYLPLISPEVAIMYSKLNVAIVKLALRSLSLHGLFYFVILTIEIGTMSLGICKCSFTHRQVWSLSRSWRAGHRKGVFGWGKTFYRSYIKYWEHFFNMAPPLMASILCLLSWRSLHILLKESLQKQMIESCRGRNRSPPPCQDPGRDSLIRPFQRYHNRYSQLASRDVRWKSIVRFS